MKQVLLINDTSHEAHIGSRAVVNIIKSLCKDYDMEVFSSYTRAEMIERPKDLVKDIDKADLVMINGEGSLHDHPRVATQFFPKLMRKIPNGKKTVLINALWENMEYAGIDSHLDKISLFGVRESLSYGDLSHKIESNRLLLVPDLIFYSDFNNADKTGYCDSVDHKVRSTFKRNPNYFPLNYIDSGTYLAPKTLTYPSLQAYVSWLKTLDLFITGRFHGACLAILAETPFLALSSNSHKLEGLVKDIGEPKLLLKDLKEIEGKRKIAREQIVNMQQYKRRALFSIHTLFLRISKL